MCRFYVDTKDSDSTLDNDIDLKKVKAQMQKLFSSYQLQLVTELGAMINILYLYVTSIVLHND